MKRVGLRLAPVILVALALVATAYGSSSDDSDRATPAGTGASPRVQRGNRTGPSLI